jgi:ribosomal protein L24E
MATITAVAELACENCGIEILPGNCSELRRGYLFCSPKCKDELVEEYEI